MPVANPQYNPDWQEVYDFNKAELDRLMEEYTALTASDSSDHERIDQINEKLGVHLKETQNCLSNYQHKTIQDAARYIFKNFDPAMMTYSLQISHQMDFEQFQTMQDIHDAWDYAHKVSERLQAKKTKSLPIGAPEGRDAFTNTGNNFISSERQTFYAKELYPNGFNSGGDLDAIVTVDQRDGEYHVCFTEDPDAAPGLAIQPHFEALATALYHRALLVEKERKQQQALTDKTAPDPLAGLKNLVNIATGQKEDKNGIKPGQIRFYIHHLPTKYNWEIFHVMDLKFENGRYALNGRGFKPQNVIPEAIQNAYESVSGLAQEHAGTVLKIQGQALDLKEL